ncbi:MAG: glycosyltransferase [Acidimicrobiales bacterium]
MAASASDIDNHKLTAVRRSVLARFAVVGSLVTAIDVAVFVLLLPRSLVVADVVAVVVATAGSTTLHQAVTFRGDPYDRWLARGRDLWLSALVGLAVDLSVVVIASGGLHPSTTRGVVAKLVAIAVVAPLRWLLHRRVLFGIVRDKILVPQPGRPPSPGAARLSVVLPAYGEADRIGAAVSAVRSALGGIDGGLEIVVVDDGSIDETAANASAAGADVVVVQPDNRGKGAAVRAGVLAAHGRTVAFTDADLAYEPSQLVHFVEAVEAGWDVVVGSRKADDTRTLVRAGRLREIGGRAVNWLTHAVLLGHHRDTQCGLKAFRSDTARLLFSRARINGFAFDVELFVIVERNGLALTEVPVTVANTTRSTVHVARDAARLVRDLFRVRRWAREGAYQLDGPEPMPRGGG